MYKLLRVLIEMLMDFELINISEIILFGVILIVRVCF